MRIRGEQLYIFSGESAGNTTPIGCSTDCVLSLTHSPVELCRKGGGRRLRAGYISWSVSCNGMYAYGNNTSMLRLANMIGQPISVVVSILQRELADAGVDLSMLTPEEEVSVVGTAILTSADYAGSKGGIATYAVSYAGSGELSLMVDRGGFPYIFPIVFR